MRRDQKPAGQWERGNGNQKKNSRVKIEATRLVLAKQVEDSEKLDFDSFSPDANLPSIVIPDDLSPSVGIRKKK